MEKSQQTGAQQIAQHGDKGHTGAKSVQTVGEVDSVDKENDAKEGDGIIGKAQIQRTAAGQADDRREQAQLMQAEQKAEGDGKLQYQLLPGQQAQIAMHDHLDEVIQEADEARPEGQKQHQQHRLHLMQADSPLLCTGDAGEIDQPQRTEDAQNKAQSSHGGGALLFVVPGGAVLTDGLPEVQAAQRRDQQPSRRRSDDKTGQRGLQKNPREGGRHRFIPPKSHFRVKFLQHVLQPHGMAGLGQQRVAGMYVLL